MVLYYIDLGEPSDWKLKGEGNANAVFGYVGANPDLCGQVVRVDKGKQFLPEKDGKQQDGVNDGLADAIVKLEEEIWAAVPGLAAPDELQRRANYVELVMAPALGPAHVHPQLLVHAPGSFLRHLVSRFARGDGVEPRTNLLAVQPDHTTFAGQDGGGSAAAAKLQGGDAAGANSRSQHDSTNLQCGDIAGGSSGTEHGIAGLGHEGGGAVLISAAAAGAASITAAAGTADALRGCSPTASAADALRGCGPTVCVEIKPKSGALVCPVEGVAMPPGAALKQAHHRYSLHQLLKLSQGKVSGCSEYNPGDLYSNDPSRMRVALAALWRHPQNNLVLFVDGQRLPVPPPGGEGGGVGAAGEGFCGDAVALEAVQALAPGQDDASEVLVRVAQRVLSAEGVLQRLLAVQQVDAVGVEGAYALLCRLLQERCGLDPLPPCLPPPPSPPAHDDASPAPANGADGVGSSNGDVDDGIGMEKRGGGGVDDGEGMAGAGAAAGREEGTAGGGVAGGGEGERWADYHRRLAAVLALPPAEAMRLLRRYLVAMTAKDCGLMLALQRVEPPPTGPRPSNGEGRQHHRAADQRGELVADEGATAATEPAAAAAAAMGGGGERTVSRRGGCGLLRDQGSGLWFRYKLAFVDLDIKPLAKLPHHYTLDRDIVDHALQVLRDNPSTLGPPAWDGGSAEQQQGSAPVLMVPGIVP